MNAEEENKHECQPAAISWLTVAPLQYCHMTMPNILPIILLGSVHMWNIFMGWLTLPVPKNHE